MGGSNGRPPTSHLRVVLGSASPHAHSRPPPAHTPLPAPTPSALPRPPAATHPLQRKMPRHPSASALLAPNACGDGKDHFANPHSPHHRRSWDEIHVHLCLRQCGTTSPITSRYPTLRMLCPTSLEPRLSLLPRFKPFPQACAPKRHFTIELTVSEIERI